MTSKHETTAGKAAEEREAPSALSRFFTYRISLLSRLLATEGGRRYTKKFNLTMPQWRVVSTLGHFRELPVTGIAERVFMDRAQVSRTIESLVERGLVRMRPNIEDRRSTLFSLSHAGEDLYAAALPAAMERQEELMSGFSPDEIDVFDRMLDELLRRVRAQLEEGRE
ncbi:hypothetical protein DRV85_14060 [Rhodosalinus halophilus]|uniref:HTH marR-type domain-containing protein n=1 Tax=Rhodosalinus halophilus TaxID=2259333 RepID=A0A365U612_9RHOB|nr:MarR family transcriptional regulator [Rhodosalinus halophilus]RBI83776.1 hypothetical protein DRV85_14060 [Rhodosalinus halophilus]